MKSFLVIAVTIFLFQTTLSTQNKLTAEAVGDKIEIRINGNIKEIK